MAQGNPLSGNDGPTRADGGARGGKRRFAVALGIILAIALIGAVVFLHVSGAIGPGLH